MASREWDLVVNTYPEMIVKFRDVLKGIAGKSSLEPKVLQMLLLAMFSAQRQPAEIPNHVRLAVEAGATREEVLGAVSSIIPVFGPVPVMSVIETVLEALDQYAPVGKE